MAKPSRHKISFCGGFHEYSQLSTAAFHPLYSALKHIKVTGGCEQSKSAMENEMPSLTRTSGYHGYLLRTGGMGSGIRNANDTVQTNERRLYRIG